jgi:CheY-like chemotaxis protein
VRRIQEFSRKGEGDKYFTSVNVNELIDRALEFTRVRWKDDAELKGIKINIQKEFLPLPLISGSASELREVFTNIFSNSLDAMPQGGTIRIKTFKENSHIAVKIEDTGVGIPETIKERIFDPFFTTKGPQSSGLGMSASYGIINRHRGTIMVDSNEGKGTVFTIKIPMFETALEEAKQVGAVSGEAIKASILVFEDEKEVRDLLSAILTKGGHEVEAVSDASQGLELFEKKNFDLVFTDLGMPEISGWQVAEKIKAINGRVPVILVTGWNIQLDHLEMKERWVDLVFLKPFGVESILRLVQEGMVLRERFKAV